MAGIDYQAIGFKCGIEIHQQLDTHKLFCSCPSTIIDSEPDFSVRRYLRAAAGETGHVDVAAAHEMGKQKRFVYHGYYKNTCLVELDEEPPHPLNHEALEIALQIAKLLNARVVDAIQVMRKTVVDGSNTTGFQRTALIAQDGFVETSKGRVGIPTICLEEDSAKIVQKTESEDTYNLSRLGFPLVEIGTDASINDPEHALEVASQLGMVVRSARVKRGLGTIRQDVNLSIKGGARVEIKGFQDLKAMPKIIEREVERQRALVAVGMPVAKEVRRAEADFTTTFMRPLPGAARMYPETDVPLIRPMAEGIEAPTLLSEKQAGLERMGVPKELSGALVKGPELALFERFVASYKKLEPTFIAATLINSPKEIKKRYNIEPRLTEQTFALVFGELDAGRISKEAVLEILVEASKGGLVNLEKYRVMGKDELEQKLKQLVSENPGVQFNAMIGKAMAQLRGKADGKLIAEMLKREMGA